MVKIYSHEGKIFVAKDTKEFDKFIEEVIGKGVYRMPRAESKAAREQALKKTKQREFIECSSIIITPHGETLEISAIYDIEGKKYRINLEPIE